MVTVVNYVRELGVFITYGVVRSVDNRTYPQQLAEAIGEIVEEVKKSLSIDLKNHPVIRAYRDFYWRVLDIDPTKQRPSQEALLRRVLRGEPLPKINPVVDAGNAISIKYLVPIGLYDVAKIRGDTLYLRKSRRGEVFKPIGGDAMELDEQIVLASESQILHVYPYRDSVETKVDETTRDVLMVVAGVSGVKPETLIDAANHLGKLLSLLGGTLEGVKTA